MSVIRPDHDIPQWLEGEPAVTEITWTGLAREFFKKHFQLLLLTPFAALALALYLPLRIVFPRPPIVPTPGRYLTYFRAVFTVRPQPAPALSTRYRVFLAVWMNLFTSPVKGVCWFIDDIFYRGHRRVEITSPVFLISAARSGSTQLVHYLEDDPATVSPNVLQLLFPFLWLWKLAPRTIGRLLDPEAVRRKLLADMPAGYVQRHEMDPFRPDTFEVVFLAKHMLPQAFLLGPEFLLEQFSHYAVQPHDRGLWERDFMSFIDAIMKKSLYFSTSPDERADRRVLIKGHFLAAAESLARRYPDARFLTVIRLPAKRIRSFINFLYVAPFWPPMVPGVWPWLVQFSIKCEIEYCQREMDWFRTTDARCCVIPFKDYVADLQGTMKTIYRECFDADTLPEHVPTEHTPRQRKNYMVDRSLDQLGIDEDALDAELADYIRWCKGEIPLRETSAETEESS